MLGASNYHLIAIAVLPLLFAITVHEFAHGWMAGQLGDSTARRLGRLTLNPFRHIDPVGTVLVPLLMLATFGFPFGWARPVPVTVANLHNPGRDMALVAAAGPVSNLLMAVAWALIAVIGGVLRDGATVIGEVVQLMGILGVTVNVVLMVLNLIPLPPLDGGRMAAGLLPGPLAWRLSRVEPYGFFILIGLVALGGISRDLDLLGKLVGPVSSSVSMFILRTAGILGGA